MTIVRIPVRIENTSPAGGPWMNVLHVSTQFAPPTVDLGEALDAIEAFYTTLLGLYPAGATITIGEGMIADPGGTPVYVDDDARVLTGVGPGGSNLSALLAVVIGWRTASATRSGRGRTFIGPLVTAQSEADGTPTATALTVLNAAASTLVADSSSANGWAFGVLSTLTGTFRPATGHTVRDRFSYLSSRRD